MKLGYQKFKQDHQGKRVLIMGLGLQGGGLSDAIFFKQLGCQVTITDLKTEAELKPSLDQLKGEFKLVLGRHQEEDFISHELIIKNPGVADTSPFLALAKRAEVPIKMSTSLLAKYSPALMIGITGTRGKSTTTQLIYEILQAGGKSAYLAGNVRGQFNLPLLTKLKTDDYLVLELSSWELNGFHQEKISPQLAVLTNIYPDHLNYYSSMAEYVADKQAIFQYQQANDYLVVNKNNLAAVKLVKPAKSQLVWFKRVDWTLAIKGEHNQENAAAAYQVAKILKLDLDEAKTVITGFRGLAYRLESRGEVNGVEFINDTTSTTPVAGLKALKAIKQPIILLAGGHDKNLVMVDWIKQIAKRVKAVFLLEGSATDELVKLLIKAGAGDKIKGRSSNFKTAVNQAYTLAEPGEVVLLSPGCASFGMFKNEFDRGDQFNQIVIDLRTDAQKRL